MATRSSNVNNVKTTNSELAVLLIQCARKLKVKSLSNLLSPLSVQSVLPSLTLSYNEYSQQIFLTHYNKPAYQLATLRCLSDNHHPLYVCTWLLGRQFSSKITWHTMFKITHFTNLVFFLQRQMNYLRAGSNTSSLTLNDLWMKKCFASLWQHDIQCNDHSSCLLGMGEEWI